MTTGFVPATRLAEVLLPLQGPDICAPLLRNGIGVTVTVVSAPEWLIDAVSAMVETGDERAVYYEGPDEYVVVVTGREFVLSAVRGVPSRADPRGNALVRRFSKEGERRSIAIPYVELDTSALGPANDLPLGAR